MDFCDLSCKYASFPTSAAVDGSFSCQTFIALYCKKRRSLVHKNLPCGDKKSVQKKRGKEPSEIITLSNPIRLMLSRTVE